MLKHWLKRRIQLDGISISRNRQVKFNNANINQRIRSNLPIHFKVRGYDIEYGRIFNEERILAEKD